MSIKKQLLDLLCLLISRYTW